MAEFEFQPQQKVVYPAHGVGTVLAIETQVIGGTEITTYVVHFERDKMTLRIPVKKAIAVGLRPLCTVTELKKVSKTLKSKPKIGRGMWSRRAKEYEGKINSGSIVSLAEVVRDLHRNVNDPDRSYSERVIYENALERLAGEVSAVRMIGIEQASNYLVKTINDNTPKEEEAVA
jgi:CarD family transcriptional regulator